jgi:hypothetical protein
MIILGQVGQEKLQGGILVKKRLDNNKTVNVDPYLEAFLNAFFIGVRTVSFLVFPQCCRVSNL